MSATRDPGRSRAHYLPMLLGSIVLIFFLLFLILITGGIFFYIVLVITAFVPLGMLHYWVWGKSFEDQTAGEREEADLLERIKQEPGQGDKPEQRIWTPRS